MQSWSQRGVTVACVTGESTPIVMSGVMAGDYQLVFFTPEILLTKSKWRDMLLGDVYRNRIKALVVDEAHCMKKW